MRTAITFCLPSASTARNAVSDESTPPDSPTIPVGNPRRRTPSSLRKLMGIPGVVGVYEGRARGGETVIRVMLAARSDSTRRRIPRRLDGYRVEVEGSCPIVPLGH